MFSMKHYEDVSNAYIRGISRNPNPQRIASVASFFVSRVDTYADRELEIIGTEEALALRGKAAIANSKIVYRRFREVFSGEEFAAQRRRGARVQRVLWGSTSTKNPAYSDLIYVDGLIGPDTVNTIPADTLEAFLDHGQARRTVD
jgi:transaldolase